MTEARYITPRLGSGSATILGLSAALAITLSFLHRSSRQADTVVTEIEGLLDFSVQMCLTGLIYGLAAGGCWLATVIEGPFTRWVARLGLLALLLVAWDQFSPGSWIRHLANLGGLMVGQCILFAWMGIPRWQGLKTDAEDPKRFQFGIGDIVIMTTCVALLLSVGIRYAPPTDPHWYWSVLLLCWIVGPLITAFAARSTLHADGRWLANTMAAVTLIWMGVAALVAAESILVNANNGIDAERVVFYVVLYGFVMAGYVVTFLLFAVSGRIQAAAMDPDLLDS